MNIDSIPEALQTKMRIAILAAIFHDEKDFNTLKDILDATDGNLSVQLSKLEQFGCLTITKIMERKSRTVYTITEYGKQLFQEYVEMLTGFLGEKKEIN